MSYGLYIHTPFCVSKCPYCDFYSAASPPARIRPLVDAIVREMATRRSSAPTAWADSLYIGGGTPSRLPVWALRRLVEGTREHLGLADGAEMTAEVNPESFTPAKAAALQELGVNRLSVGVQALDDGLLRALGRPHDARQARVAAERARAMFDAVSFDLIIGVPGMTLKGLDDTLAALLDLDPDHLAVYELTVEPGTPLAAARARGVWRAPDEELCLRMDALVEERLEEAGLRRYEVSNYARPGRECRHNLAIWRGGWYLGLGPAAHSRLPVAGGRWGRHAANVRDLEGYIERLERGASPVANEGGTPLAQFLEERLLLGLRLSEGLDLGALKATIGVAETLFEPQILARLVGGGFVELDRGWLRATAAGRRVLDEVIARLAIGLRPDVLERATAPPPADSTASAPLPADSTATAPLPADSTATAPLPADSTASAPLPADSTASATTGPVGV